MESIRLQSNEMFITNSFEGPTGATTMLCRPSRSSSSWTSSSSLCSCVSMAMMAAHLAFSLGQEHISVAFTTTVDKLAALVGFIVMVPTIFIGSTWAYISGPGAHIWRGEGNRMEKYCNGYFHDQDALWYVTICNRVDSRFVPSQWEMALLCNDVSHWLGAHLESALCNEGISIV